MPTESQPHQLLSQGGAAENSGSKTEVERTLSAWSASLWPQESRAESSHTEDLRISPLTGALSLSKAGVRCTAAL